MGSIVFCLIEDKIMTAVDNNLQTVMNRNEQVVNLLPTTSQDCSKPGTSKECYGDLDDALSSDLDSEQERAANELAAIWEDSDCSIRDKDYVPDSETSSEEGKFQ